MNRLAIIVSYHFVDVAPLIKVLFWFFKGVEKSRCIGISICKYFGGDRAKKRIQK